MNVILADVLGYCMGVRRAVDSAIETLKNNQNNKVYSLGPLIHNQVALDKLSSMGLKVLREPNIDLLDERSVVIIRAHGVPPQVIEKLTEKNSFVVNATCPRVLASQNNAKRYSSMNYTVILAGDTNHGEAVGIAGYAGKKFILVENKEDAEKLPSFNDDENAVLLCQTTFSMEEFKQIADVLSEKIRNLKVLNTICSATKERQEALQRLCPSVDGILVVGGKNSANTKRLLQIAQENCPLAALIETADEIPENFFALDNVGITAGASTPDSVIDEVMKRLKDRN